jgi:hypothetical protein
VRLKLEQSEHELSKRKVKDNFVKENAEKSEPTPQKFIIESQPSPSKKEEESAKPESSRLEKKYDFEDSP